MKAIILFSGGVDSTVALAMAQARGLECHAISFNYGQRHVIELEYAKKITQHYNINHKIIIIDPNTFAKSSLTSNIPVPKDRNTDSIASGGIPNTYVPARNTLFISYAIGQAEIHNAQEIHVGCNALDRNPYPDCRIEYLNAFQKVINLATKQAIEGNPPKIVFPLIEMGKAEIFQKAFELKAPIELTFSCYDPTDKNQPCGRCDACFLRHEGLSQFARNV
jgi:7-cyano-7-deazaguanine synthase